MAQPSPPSLSYNNRKWCQITECQQVFVADLVWPKDTLDVSQTFSLEDIKFPGDFPGHLPALGTLRYGDYGLWTTVEGAFFFG